MNIVFETKMIQMLQKIQCILITFVIDMYIEITRDYKIVFSRSNF